MGVEMLYGRLPTTRSFCPACTAKAVKSTRSTSASMTVRSLRLRKRAAKSRSSSMTVKWRLAATSGVVIAPKPGPISISAWPGCGAMVSTMAASTVASVKKC